MDWTGPVPVEPDTGDADARIVGAPVAELRADESRNGGIHVTGTVVADVEVRCRRCVVVTTRQLPVPIELRLEPDVREWEEAPGLYALDAEAEEVNLLPALREELALALPSYPLCRPDCRGLCPRCGADLNETACGCEVKKVDARWDALKNEKEG